MRVYNERGDSISAFEESFGTRLDVMDVRLTAYFRERGLTVLEMDRPAVDVEISKRKLTTDEAAYILGNSAYESGKYEAALNYLNKAEAKNSGAARALILKALLINRQGDFDEGRNLREMAMGFAPNDAYVLAGIAHIEWEEYDSTESRTR